MGIKKNILKKIWECKLKIRELEYICNPKCLKKRICKMYFKYTGENINIDNPKNFNEFIQKLKVYDNKTYKCNLSDKYLMRKYVEENFGEKYLPKLIDVYNKFEEIDFDTLPNSFVLKCNHGSGYNKVVKNKNEINITLLKKDFKRWMNENFAFNGYEMQYKDIPRKIICEEFLGDNIIDIQVWCAKGKVLFISYIESPHGINKKISYDENWNKLDFVTSEPWLEKNVDKPKQLEEILKMARFVSKDMEFIRFDLYLLGDGSVKISEFTFTPANGFLHWSPVNMNEKIYNLMINKKG